MRHHGITFFPRGGGRLREAASRAGTKNPILALAEASLAGSLRSCYVRALVQFTISRNPGDLCMPSRALRSALVWVVLLGASPATVCAQWLNYPTPGIPRLANGAPDLKAPAPRTPDGKPDFSGMWFANVPSRDFCREKDCIQEERMAREQINLGIKLKDGLPYTEWSREQMKIRRANGGREDPHSYCMPPNFPRAWTLPQHSRIVQTPGMMVVLHEFNAAYREVYLDGRPLPVNPNPTWNGYSTGHWEGDTLVIETNGIRDDMWLDIQGSPVTESARVTERLKRVNLRPHADRDRRERSQGLHQALVGDDRNGRCRWTRRCSKRFAWTTNRTPSSTNMNLRPSVPTLTS